MNYQINIDKKVLRLLGSQLYGDTPSIISELVQNAYDADARNVWITINTTAPSTIIVKDDGIGMTPNEINLRFLNIGQNRREKYPISPAGRKVLGRKGIGKLAVFSLAKVIDIYSLKDGSIAACRLDFDDITLNDADPIDLNKTTSSAEYKHLFSYSSGTNIILNNIQKDVSRSLNYIVNRLVRTFDVNSNDFKIYIRKNNDSFNELTRKKLDFFKNMDTIITFGKEYTSKIDLVKNNNIDNRYKYAAKYESITNIDEKSSKIKLQPMPYEIDVLNKLGQAIKIPFSFSGWIGTMVDRPSFQNFLLKNFENDNKFEISLTDNRITIFSRGKIGEFDILPKTQTNHIADAYIIGEIYADIFEDDNLSDMAISNRRGYDETDQRYVQLIKTLTPVVAYITRKKENIKKNKKADEKEQEIARIKDDLAAKSPKTQKAIKTKLTPTEQKDFQNELFQFGRALKLSGNSKKIFISHKSDCDKFGKFLVRCFELVGLPPKNNIIFTSMLELGVPFGKDIYDYLKNCFRDDLYVIFLFSRSFYNSNICIAETGAAWATNKDYSNVVIDMDFSYIDEPINNNKLGISFNINLQSEDFSLNLAELIRTTLTSIGYTPIPNNEKIFSAINKALSEYNNKLSFPEYLPKRKFLAVPLCPNCSSPMKLETNGNGLLQYRCNGNCKIKINAAIETR